LTAAVNKPIIQRIYRGEWLALAANWVLSLRMNSGEKRYIWQAGDWPNWRYGLSAFTGQLAVVVPRHARARRHQRADHAGCSA